MLRKKITSKVTSAEDGTSLPGFSIMNFIKKFSISKLKGGI
jgi:hypothetical protein